MSAVLDPGSYDPRTVVPGGLEAECVRLEQQAALSFPDELSILREVLTGRRRLVEIGAGCGAATARLRAEFPETELIGVDHDEALLDRIRDADRRIVADAAAVPLPTGSADVVYLRYVLQHLRDPAAALAEAWRLLAPGGVVVVTEVDAELWGVADPPASPRSRAVMQNAYGAIDVAQRERGGDRLLGRRTTRLLRSAGFGSVVLRPFATTSDGRPITDFALHLGPQRWAPLVAAGTLSPLDLALIANTWRSFAADPDAWVMLLGLTAIGVRTM